MIKKNTKDIIRMNDGDLRHSLSIDLEDMMLGVRRDDKMASYPISVEEAEALGKWLLKAVKLKAMLTEGASDKADSQELAKKKQKLRDYIKAQYPKFQDRAREMRHVEEADADQIEFMLDQINESIITECHAKDGKEIKVGDDVVAMGLNFPSVGQSTAKVVAVSGDDVTVEWYAPTGDRDKKRKKVSAKTILKVLKD